MAPKYVIIYEDPINLDAPVAIITPAQEWIREQGLSEEDAIEAIAEKDLPEHVFNHKGNKRTWYIVPTESLGMNDRTFRNAWKINHDEIAN